MTYLILEGADLTGKTCIAKKLRDEHGWEYEHLGVPEPGDHEAFLLQPKKAFTVLDRWHLGSFVYQYFLNASPAMITSAQLNNVIAQLAERRCITAVVWCAGTALESRYHRHVLNGTRKEQFTQAQINATNVLYNIMAGDTMKQRFGISWRLDTTRESASEIAEKINHSCRRLWRHA